MLQRHQRDDVAGGAQGLLQVETAVQAGQGAPAFRRQVERLGRIGRGDVAQMLHAWRGAGDIPAAPAILEGAGLVGEVERMGRIGDQGHAVGGGGDIGHDPARRHGVDEAVADGASRAFFLQPRLVGLVVVEGIKSEAAAPVVGQDFDQPALMHRTDRDIVVEIDGAGRRWIDAVELQAGSGEGQDLGFRRDPSALPAGYSDSHGRRAHR